MKVSVILTSYNKKKYLPQAIESVLGQTFRDFELIIADDNSDDGSWGLIRHYMFGPKQDARVFGFRTDLDPSGHSVDLNRYNHNINLAITHATGDYITYLCDDDWFLPDRLHRMVDYLDTHVHVMMCYGVQQTAYMVDGEVRMGALRIAPKVLLDAVMRVDHSSVMHRRELFGIVGGWPEAKETWRMGDAAFWAKLALAGIPFYRVDKEPTDVHRYNELSVTYALDNPKYPPYDDQGNKRTINSGVDPAWSAIG